MISPDEIRAKAERWWNDGSFLKAVLLNGSFFPKYISAIGLDKPANDLSALNKIKQEQETIRQHSKSVTGYGYTVRWEKRNSRLIGENEFITAIYFENVTEYLKYIRKEKPYKTFLDNVQLIRNEFAELESWICANSLRIIAHANDWTELLAVCRYFKNEHTPGKYYVREIPVPIDTKFIENHDTVLKSLLDTLIPNMVNLKEKSFAKRYGLRYNQPSIRIRFLDKELQAHPNISDMTIPLSEACTIQIDGLKRIVIAENLMNFLTIPLMKNTIAIWSGGGFNIDYLKCIEWMKNPQLFYWGDIDSHGLQILSQCRQYFPKTKALMMNMETLMGLKKHWGKGSKTNAHNLSGLSEEEKRLFEFVNNNNIRLEQEKIPQAFALGAFNLIHAE